MRDIPIVRFFFATHALRVIYPLVTVTLTSIEPPPDLTARFALIIEGLMQDVAAAAVGRWGLAPLVLWLIRPYLRHLVKQFGAVVAQSKKPGLAQPDTTRPAPLPDFASPLPAARRSGRPGLGRAAAAYGPRAFQAAPADTAPPPPSTQASVGRTRLTLVLARPRGRRQPWHRAGDRPASRPRTFSPTGWKRSPPHVHIVAMSK